jgi:hypothetical protein
MLGTQGWKQVLLPWLQSQIRNSWVDPKSFKNDEEYAYAMKTAWALAHACDAILAFTEKAVEESDQLTKKENGEMIPKTIN